MVNFLCPCCLSRPHNPTDYEREQFIVRAVNNHARLVAALREVSKWVLEPCARDVVRAALAAVEKGE